MIDMRRYISFLSIGIVLFVGIIIVTGYLDFIEPTYRIGLGLLVILYAGVRLIILFTRKHQSDEKP